MKKNTALLLIDVQRGFEQTDYWGGQRNNPDAELKMFKLLELWRAQNIPVIHIKHDSTNPDSPLRPGQIGNQIKSEVFPRVDEVLFTKNVNSAFIGTSLENYLRQQDIRQLVICGFITDHCISTTARMAANLGFEVTIVDDATATFDREFQGKVYRAEDIHTYHLLSLQGEFAEIISTKHLIRAFREKLKT